MDTLKRGERNPTALELVVDSFKLKVGGLYIPGNLFFTSLRKLKAYLVRLLFPKSALVLLYLGYNFDRLKNTPVIKSLLQDLHNSNVSPDQLGIQLKKTAIVVKTCLTKVKEITSKFFQDTVMVYNSL